MLTLQRPGLWRIALDGSLHYTARASWCALSSSVPLSPSSGTRRSRRRRHLVPPWIRFGRCSAARLVGSDRLIRVLPGSDKLIISHLSVPPSVRTPVCMSVCPSVSVYNERGPASTGICCSASSSCDAFQGHWAFVACLHCHCQDLESGQLYLPQIVWVYTEFVSCWQCCLLVCIVPVSCRRLQIDMS